LSSKLPSFTIITISIVLILCGLSLSRFLNIQLNPSASTSSFIIYYSWQEAGARVAEQEVTSKLEALCAGVKGVKNISSKSENGGGSIQVELDKIADADAVRFEISTLIRQARPELPDGVSYPVISENRQDDEKDKPLLSYTFNAGVSPNIIQKYAEDYIKPVMAQIPGIYKTEVYGASPMEWQIIYDADKIKALGIRVADIQKAVNLLIQKENIGVTDLSVPVVLASNTGNFQNVGKAVNMEANPFSSIPVTKTEQRTVFLGDIAHIAYSESKPQSYYRINGLNTINIVVYATAGENNLALSKKVQAELKRLSLSFPKDYKLLLSYDSTEYIGSELHNIGLRTLFTLVILLLFVFGVTRRAKYMFLILFMLFANLCIAAIFYYLLKIEIHLYALAGITVSLGLMTDNIIIMSDHLRTRGNSKAWLAIFAGTLATISALTIIFFLEERIKANLVDFALVIIINQAVSLVTALFLIPAVMEKMGLMKGRKVMKELRMKNEGIKNGGNERIKNERIKNEGMKELRMKNGKFLSFFHFFIHSLKLKLRKGRVIRVTNVYQKSYLFLRRRKAIAITIFVLGFGLPVFLLPDKWEGGSWYNKLYNTSLGSDWYKENAKPWTDKILGGSLRLFSEHVFEGSYFRDSEETSLYISVSMPNGSTVEQMNGLVGNMESYLKQFPEIRMFQANIYPRNSSITVYFKKEFQSSGFPYQLKGQTISKAIELGGADWGVFGFGDGFSNSVHEMAGNYTVEMLGYNYDELNTLASKLRLRLMENPRVKDVYILPERTWYKPDNTEFLVSINKEAGTVGGITPGDIYASLQNVALTNNAFTAVYAHGSFENVRLFSAQSKLTDVWQLERMPLLKDSAYYKFNTLCKISKEATTPSVCKENQQYRLILQFDYIGSDKFARKYTDKTVAAFKPLLPLGYSAQTNDNFWYWNQQNKKQYWLLGLIIVMIFFICAILFESFIQPFAVILTIPVAYIGIFLTFYLFDLNFDQGGFAAFVMLSGITVNAAIYILNDFNNLKRSHASKNISDIRLYFKAFNYKIIPILLTIVSTVLGFVPFLIGEKQPFWFSLAAGTIGGLIFSLVGIMVYLPLFLKLRIKNEGNEGNEGMKE